jgi:hypothetical protein
MALHSCRPTLPLLLLAFLTVPSFPMAQEALPNISAGGYLSARAVNKGQTVQFTLAVKNKADAKTKPSAVARSLHLYGLPAQYQLEKICVLPLLPLRTDPCQNAAQFASAQNMVWDTLAPGQSITVQGNLRSDAPRKTSTLTASLVWDFPAPGSSLAISLGENQVRDWYQAEWINDALTKALGLPAVLALLTAALAFYVTKRQQQQALRAETWKQLLPLSHRYAAKFYLPLSLAATRLAENLRVLGPKSGDERIAFFYVLLCYREMAKTRKAIGGLYFKDLRGEDLAGECWRLQREALISANEEDPFNLAIRYAVERITGVENYAAFKRKFEIAGAATITYNHPDIQTAWTRFRSWLAEEPAKGLVFLSSSFEPHPPSATVAKRYVAAKYLKVFPLCWTMNPIVRTNTGTAPRHAW